MAIAMAAIASPAPMIVGMGSFDLHELILWIENVTLMPHIGAGDAMAAMAIAMAGIWRVHETATPGHHNRWHTLTFYYIKRDMKQGQIEVKMYICIK